jgi:hypothetical protein
MRIFFLLVLLAGFSASRAQDATELNRRNGFKSIKLGYPIDSVKGAVLKKDFLEKDEFPAKLYETSDREYMTIGEVIVKDIKVMTYMNQIYKIVVTTEKDARLMKALDKTYGNSIYVVRSAKYTWKADDLNLTFKAEKNRIELIYRSYPVLQKMYADKGKKIDRIAEDL